jgi:two-component system CheB/CheR fusion protein
VAGRDLDGDDFGARQVPRSEDRCYVVRITPYRRLDNALEGVVIAFVDITVINNLEATLRQKLLP